MPFHDVAVDQRCMTRSQMIAHPVPGLDGLERLGISDDDVEAALLEMFNQNAQQPQVGLL